MKKILLIDDEQMLCTLVKKNLEITGEFSVTTLSDPRFAVETALRAKPDVILLDVMMPGTSGSAVAALLRDKGVTNNAPIIFLTGILSPQEVNSKDNIIGNEYFVAKPVAIPDLIAVIKRVSGG